MNTVEQVHLAPVVNRPEGLVHPVHGLSLYNTFESRHKIRIQTELLSDCNDNNLPVCVTLNVA